MKKLTLILMCFLTCLVKAQEEDTLYVCKKNTQFAKMYLTGNAIVLKDVPKAIEKLTKFANNGCVNAQYELGKIYKRGVFVAVDEELAYQFTKMAADQAYPKAIAHLGELHQRGIGCTLDYDKAFELYEQADSLGDHGMGAYYIGYNYFKGLGPVEQDYTKAIEWFSISEYPMAIHFLGLMNYFGYGMPVNKDKAYELLLSNEKIKNSKALLAHLEASKTTEQSILSDYQGMDVALETEKINSLLEEDETYAIANENTNITPKELNGNWSGKLVELDWSGERILRMLPANFSIEGEDDTLNFSATLEHSSDQGEAILLDESLYFENFSAQLSRIYTDNEEVPNLNYAILNTEVQLKTVDHIRFLIGYVETKVLDWSEPGPPMLLVLVNDKVLTDNGIEISKELIEALIEQQGDNFISLYPNPFVDDLLIQYELATQSNATVEIYSLDGAFSHIIADQEVQNAGKQLFQFNGGNLPLGLYVVRVTANGVVHTKLIIKEN